MKTEKIFIRTDKSRVKIEVHLYLDITRGAVYRISVSVCQPGKRKFIYIDRNDYEYRSLSMREREKSLEYEQLKYVSSEEILESKMELWQRIKPKQ